MPAEVASFLHAPTGSWAHVVADPATRAAAIIDPVLDYDWRSARTGTTSAARIAEHCRASGLEVRWILETHAHADHLSAAQYLQQQLGGKIAIGRGILGVQRTFKRIFNLGDEFAPEIAPHVRVLLVEFPGDGKLSGPKSSTHPQDEEIAAVGVDAVEHLFPLSQAVGRHSHEGHVVPTLGESRGWTLRR